MLLQIHNTLLSNVIFNDMSMVVYQQSVAEVVACCKVSTNVKNHDFTHTVYIVI